MIGNKHVRQIFAGHDSGHYGLPPRLLTLRKAADALPLPPLAEPAVVTLEALAESGAERVIAGEPAPAAAQVITTANATHATWELETRYRAEVSRRADAMITAEVLESADEVIGKHLQPALAQLVGELGKVAAVLPPDTTAAQVLAAASASWRKSWETLNGLGARYSGLRTAYAAFPERVEYDTEAEFAEFSNLTKFFPGWRRRTALNVVGEVRDPWPSEPAERLLWLHHHGAQFVIPTSAERDRMWWDKYGEGVQERRRNAEVANQWRAFTKGERIQLPKVSADSA